VPPSLQLAATAKIRPRKNSENKRVTEFELYMLNYLRFFAATPQVMLTGIFLKYNNQLM